MKQDRRTPNSQLMRSIALFPSFQTLLQIEITFQTSSLPVQSTKSVYKNTLAQQPFYYLSLSRLNSRIYAILPYTVQHGMRRSAILALMRVFERTVVERSHMNIIEAVFKTGWDKQEERIKDIIARKVDDVDKALLNSGAKVTNSEREKTSKLLSTEKNRLVADQARALPNLPLGICPPAMLSNVHQWSPAPTSVHSFHFSIIDIFKSPPRIEQINIQPYNKPFKKISLSSSYHH